jgi:hypothetical protein
MNKSHTWRMMSSGLLRHVSLVSEEGIASIIRVTGIGELRKMAAVTCNRSTPYNILEDGILHGHHLENLKSYIILTG